MNTATANRVTPLREPAATTACDPEFSWGERALTAIIVRAAEAAAGRVAPHTLCRYLVDAMDWFMAARPDPRLSGDEPPPDAPADPFEAWLMARWLRDIRSDEFRGSVQAQRLMAEWERR